VLLLLILLWNPLLLLCHHHVLLLQLHTAECLTPTTPMCSCTRTLHFHYS